MKKSFNSFNIVLIGLVFLLSVDAGATDIEFSGMLQSYTGGRILEQDIPITEQTVNLSLEGWGGISEILINPYFHISENGEADWGFSEVYIDFFLSGMDLRVGKQAVIWGQAEGAFITDIVSPLDLRSYILADFSEIRKGVPAVKINSYIGAFTMEAVWIPRFVPTSLPGKDSIWYVSGMDLAESSNLPGDSLDNSEIFGKISFFGAALNAEVMAAYAWDDNPVVTGAVTTPESRYYRYIVTGGSFSTTLGPVILRGETAVYLDREFSALRSGETGPKINAESYNQIHGLLGLDWSMLGADISAQYIHQQIPDYDENLLTEEIARTVTLRVRDSYLADTLTWEFFSYLELLDLDEGTVDALLRPSIIYNLEEGVELKTGVEIFLGDESGRFGQYEDNTMAYVSVSWYF